MLMISNTNSDRYEENALYFGGQTFSIKQVCPLFEII